MTSTAIAEPETHLAAIQVTKTFPGTQALRDVSVRVSRGSIHGLVGENGAGKSTLGRIMAGAAAPDAGTIWLNGHPVRFTGLRDALQQGVALIGQEPSVVMARSVEFNVFLGAESTTWGVLNARELRARYRELSDFTGFGLRPEAIVSSLRPADLQKVQAMRALARKASFIVMDEASASLGSSEVERLLSTVRRLRDLGTTIVYISHSLREVLAIADHVTVLRDGEVVREGRAADETPDSLLTAMLGQAPQATYPARTGTNTLGESVCSVEHLTRPGLIHDVTFEIRAGEILGLAGLVGSGRSEVARAIFRADRVRSGTVVVAGRRLTGSSPRDAIRAGVSLIPESRKTLGLILDQSIVQNVTLPHLRSVARMGIVRRRFETRHVRQLVERLGVRHSGLARPVRTLSGGNQQRTLFAKWLFRSPRLLIADEPTRGVDLGARRAIYDLIVGLAATGMAVLLISSDTEEVLGLASRVLVMREGRVVLEVAGDRATEEVVLRAALGVDSTGGDTHEDVA